MLSINHEIESMLFEQATNLLQTSRVQLLEVRRHSPFILSELPGQSKLNSSLSTEKVSLKIKTGLTQEEMMQRFKSKLRNQINKGNKKHLEFFIKIMDQYRLFPPPQTFIPPALKHSFGNGAEGIQKLLNEFGIRYVTTRFEKARQFSKPLHPKITWESGVLLVDRGKPEPAWNDIGHHPAFDFDKPLLTLHWANILHQNPEMNLSIVNKWVNFIQKGVKTHGSLLTRNIEACFTQYLHKLFSKILYQDGEYSIDLNWIEKLPQNILGSSLFLKITKPPSVDFIVSGAEGICIQNEQKASIFEIKPNKEIRKILIKPVQKT